MDLFESAGFHLYTSDSTPPSPEISPVSDDHGSLDFNPSSTHNMGAVLTRNIREKDRLKKSAMPSEEPPDTVQQPPKNKAHSPTSGEVRMLNPDLACVGLSDELGVDHWGLKIIKLVAFPDLIPSSPHAPSYPTPNKSSQGKKFRPQPPIVDLTSNTLLFLQGSEGSDSSSYSSSDEEGYFSHSPQNVSTTSLTSNTSRSYSDLHSSSCNPLYKTPSKHSVSHISPLSPITPKAHSPLPRISISIAPTQIATPKSKVHLPFFSFTRTPEGSSLTTDVHVLATLFPPHERHMVICSGELDAADRRLEGIDSSDEEDEADDMCTQGSSLKCLQIDLRRFGLGRPTSPGNSVADLDFLLL